MNATSGKTQSEKLSERQEILLMSFVDGECGLLEKARAKFLLARSVQAKEYVVQLNRLSQDSKELLNKATLDSRSDAVNLWDQVAQRIQSEERAALFLGSRRTESQNSFAYSIRTIFTNPWAFRASGAALLASTIFAVILVRTSESTDSNQLVRINAPSNSVMEVRHGIPQIIEERAPTSMEVDWMRSDGRVHFLPEPSQRSAIIWVRKRQAGMISKPSRSPQLALSNQATPYSSPAFGEENR